MRLPIPDKRIEVVFGLPYGKFGRLEPGSLGTDLVGVSGLGAEQDLMYNKWLERLGAERRLAREQLGMNAGQGYHEIALLPSTVVRPDNTIYAGKIYPKQRLYEIWGNNKFDTLRYLNSIDPEAKPITNLDASAYEALVEANPALARDPDTDSLIPVIPPQKEDRSISRQDGTSVDIPAGFYHTTSPLGMLARATMNAQSKVLDAETLRGVPQRIREMAQAGRTGWLSRPGAELNINDLLAEVDDAVDYNTGIRINGKAPREFEVYDVDDSVLAPKVRKNYKGEDQLVLVDTDIDNLTPEQVSSLPTDQYERLWNYANRSFENLSYQGKYNKASQPSLAELAVDYLRQGIKPMRAGVGVHYDTTGGYLVDTPLTQVVQTPEGTTRYIQRSREILGNYPETTMDAATFFTGDNVSPQWARPVIPARNVIETRLTDSSINPTPVIVGRGGGAQFTGMTPQQVASSNVPGFIPPASYVSWDYAPKFGLQMSKAERDAIRQMYGQEAGQDFIDNLYTGVDYLNKRVEQRFPTGFITAPIMGEEKRLVPITRPERSGWITNNLGEPIHVPPHSYVNAQGETVLNPGIEAKYNGWDPIFNDNVERYEFEGGRTRPARIVNALEAFQGLLRKNEDLIPRVSKEGLVSTVQDVRIPNRLEGLPSTVKRVHVETPALYPMMAASERVYPEQAPRVTSLQNMAQALQDVTNSGVVPAIPSAVKGNREEMFLRHPVTGEIMPWTKENADAVVESTKGIIGEPGAFAGALEKADLLRGNTVLKYGEKTVNPPEAPMFGFDGVNYASSPEEVKLPLYTTLTPIPTDNTADTFAQLGFTPSPPYNDIVTELEAVRAEKKRMQLYRDDYIRRHAGIDGRGLGQTTPNYSEGGHQGVLMSERKAKAISYLNEREAELSQKEETLKRLAQNYLPAEALAEGEAVVDFRARPTMDEEEEVMTPPLPPSDRARRIAARELAATQQLTPRELRAIKPEYRPSYADRVLSLKTGQRKTREQLLQEAIQKKVDNAVAQSSIENAVDRNWLRNTEQAKRQEPVVQEVVMEQQPPQRPQGQSFEVVKYGGDITGMRANSGRSHMNSVSPEQYGQANSGWLGNPHLWTDNSGGRVQLPVEEAVARFEQDFLRKVESDEAFRNAVLGLRGKKVNYYRPEGEGQKGLHHLQVVQNWLRNQP